VVVPLVLVVLTEVDVQANVDEVEATVEELLDVTDVMGGLVVLVVASELVVEGVLVVARLVVGAVDDVVVVGVEVVEGEDPPDKARYAAAPATATITTTTNARKTAAIPLDEVRNWTYTPFSVSI
jgi:hypothetical protein